MRLYFFLIIFVVSACDTVNFRYFKHVNSLQPVSITNQKGFAGSPSDRPFFESTFEHNDPTNELWWDGNIGQWQAGILSGNYTLYVSGVDIGVYSFVDAPLPSSHYVIQVEAGTNLNFHPANQYGIIFDYQDASTFGLFFFNGYGQYSIGYFVESNWHSLHVGNLIDINLANRPFSLDLTIKGDTIEISFNAKNIVSVQYGREIIGYYGIYLGSRISDNANLSITEFSVNPK